MYTKDRLVGLLPYYLQDGENIKKYYEVLAMFYDEIIDIFKEIIDSRDIDLAEMYGLDIIGDIVVQKRTEKCKDDEQYRNRLKTKVMQNNSMGYIEDINNLANAFLGDNFIKVRQGYQYEDLNNEPAMMEVMVNANKLESSTLDNTKKNLKCGSVQLGSTCLGVGLQSIPITTQIKKYRPIFIPELQSAIGAGIKLQYRLKNDKEIIKIKENTIANIQFNAPKNIVNIVSKDAAITSNSILKCGMRSLSAEIGTLL